MDELVKNPDDCTKFEPNQFKKDKCKNCGRHWTEHKGVISEAQVQAYTDARKKAEDEKNAKEAAAKEKARAKALAKKKQTQAVEDEWLFDGDVGQDNDLGDVDDDDDMGFAMFTGGDISAALGMPNPQAASSNRPLKVTNLIDFSECDVADEEAPVPAAPPQSGTSSQAPGQQGSPHVPAPQQPSGPAASGYAPLDATGVAPFAAPAAPSAQGGEPQMTQALQEEIEHLRQMLADAHEEKNIQVMIVRDEVAEKQAAIEELARARAAAEAAATEARSALEELVHQTRRERDAALAERDAAVLEASRQAAREREQAAQLAAAGPQQEAAAAGASEAEAEALALRAEVQRLEQAARERDEALSARDAAQADADCLQAQLSQAMRQREEAAQLATQEPQQAADGVPEAEALRAEVQRLRSALVVATDAEDAQSAQALRAATAQLDEARAVEARLHESLAHAARERDEALSARDAARATAAGFEQRLLQATREREEAAQDLRAEVRRLQSALAGAGGAVDAGRAQERVEQASRDIAAGGAQVREARAAEARLHESLANAIRERDEAASARDAAQATATGLQEQLSQAAQEREQAAQDLRAEVQRLRSALAATGGDVDASCALERMEQAPRHSASGDEAEALQSARDWMSRVQSLRTRSADIIEPRPPHLASLSPDSTGVSAAVAAVVAELRELQVRTLSCLEGDGGGDCAASRTAAAGSAAGAVANAADAGLDLEAQLHGLHGGATAILAAAEAAARRADEDRRELAAARQAAAAGAVAARAAGAEEEAPCAVSTPGRVEGESPLPRRASTEARLAMGISSDVQAVNRQTARALKEIRLHAQQQLEKISRRMRVPVDGLPATQAGTVAGGC